MPDPQLFDLIAIVIGILDEWRSLGDHPYINEPHLQLQRQALKEQLKVALRSILFCLEDDFVAR